MRTRACAVLATVVALQVCAVCLGADAGDPGPTRTVASCDFEGPYSAGEHAVHQHCSNNWQWGRKEMVLKPERDAGRLGTVQSIQVRGITSGGMQFFYTNLSVKKGRHYRVSWWMKADGLEDTVRCFIRKVGYPWTTLVYGYSGMPDATWRRYSFTAPATEEMESDLGVVWETCAVGKIWIDDLLVEEADAPFEQAPALPDPPRGNLLPRCSFEVRRDCFWANGIHGPTVDGVYRGPEAEWDDPQAHQAPGGKFGKHCLAIPSSQWGGSVFCYSAPVDYVPGKPYTYSIWLKASRPQVNCSMALMYYGGQRGIAGKGCALGTEWQRVSVTATPEASEHNKLYLALVTGQKGSTLFADGAQLEAGAEATPFAPRYPLELDVDLGQPLGSLRQWGQPVPLTLTAGAAGDAAPRDAPVAVTVTAYPDKVVWQKTLRLATGEPVPLSLNVKRRGLFRVDVRPLNPSDAAPQQALFAVLPPPRPTGQASYFGTHIAVRPFFADYITRLGFKWTRFHDASVITKWAFSEPESGKLIWRDEQVAGLRKRGLHILGLPDLVPKWAEVESEDGSATFDHQAYGRYCEAVARHYRGLIDHWEVWNEPYMPGFFKGTAKEFTAVMQVACPALKRGNPDAKVVGPCVDISQPKYTEGLGADALKCLDLFSFHFYPGNLCGGGTLPFAGELPEHLKVLGERKPAEVWNSEGNNWATQGNTFYTFWPIGPRANERATAFASRVWMEHAKAGINRFFLYTTHQADGTMYHSKTLIESDRAPTPAAVASAVTAWCMDGMKVVPCDAVPGVVQSLFSGDGRATWAVYDDGGMEGRRTLALDRIPREVQLLDVMGNDPRGDGVKRWTIGWQPLFLVSTTLPAGKLADLGRRAIE